MKTRKIGKSYLEKRLEKNLDCNIDAAGRVGQRLCRFRSHEAGKMANNRDNENAGVAVSDSARLAHAVLLIGRCPKQQGNSFSAQGLLHEVLPDHGIQYGLENGLQGQCDHHRGNDVYRIDVSGEHDIRECRSEIHYQRDRKAGRCLQVTRGFRRTFASVGTGTRFVPDVDLDACVRLILSVPEIGGSFPVLRLASTGSRWLIPAIVLSMLAASSVHVARQ